MLEYYTGTKWKRASVSGYENSIIPEHRGEILLGNTKGPIYLDFIYFYEEWIGYAEVIKSRKKEWEAIDMIQEKENTTSNMAVGKRMKGRQAYIGKNM